MELTPQQKIAYYRKNGKKVLEHCIRGYVKRNRHLIEPLNIFLFDEEIPAEARERTYAVLSYKRGDWTDRSARFEVEVHYRQELTGVERCRDSKIIVQFCHVWFEDNACLLSSKFFFMASEKEFVSHHLGEFEQWYGKQLKYTLFLEIADPREFEDHYYEEDS